MGDGLELGPMTAHEVATTVDWAADEGWNPGRSDAACFRSADAGGFLAARRDGRMVGSISLVRYGPTFGFLGLYIVEPGLRGRGIGSRLWDAALALREDRVLGLDGVVAMQDSYARSGFVLAHRNIRFGGLPDLGALGAAGEVDLLGIGDLPEVSAYDAPRFGAPRPDFLRCWLDQPGALSVGRRSGGHLVGYGTVRPCRVGWKVGPLFAADRVVAEALLARLLRHAQASGPAEVFLDVPEPHRDAVDVARALGLAPRFETARMYAGGDPALPIREVFGITSFELG